MCLPAQSLSALADAVVVASIRQHSHHLVASLAYASSTSIEDSSVIRVSECSEYVESWNARMKTYNHPPHRHHCCSLKSSMSPIDVFYFASAP